MDSSNLYSLFYLKNKHKQLRLFDAEIAFIQYQDFRINLLTGDREKISVLEFIEEINQLDAIAYYKNPIVMHLMFEFGFQMVELEDLIDQRKPLAIFIKYKQSRVEKIPSAKDIKFNLESLKTVHFEEYLQKFNKVYRKLVDGEAYQINLTTRFIMRLSKKIKPIDFVARMWSNKSKVGAYSHATYINALDKLYFSNSPECLYQVDQNKIRTMPIKGTVKVKSKKKVPIAWKQLVDSKKDQAELFMISDLMRNDLTRINLNPSKVLKKKACLTAPGLVHQFSIIESDLNPDTTVADIIKKIFPGGSITGAPKKRVMEIIKKVEDSDRGFYCGSTILLFKNVHTASINIRSAEIDYSANEFHYGAGGGITLLSQAKEEFDEVLLKLKSFLLLLKE